MEIKKKIQYRLTSEDIDLISDSISEYLTGISLNRKDVLRIRLIMEEILLQYQEFFGTDHVVSLLCSKRFSRHRVQLIIEGNSFNPHSAGEETSGILESFLSNMGLIPTWQYKNNRNVITFVPPKPQRHSPLVKLAFSLLAAVILGMLSLLLPASFQHFLSEELLHPLLDTFTGLLSAVAGPLIFLSILCGIIGMSDVATFGRIGKRMIGRFLTMSTMIVVIAGFVVLPFFSVTAGNGGSLQFSELYRMILGMIPSNFFTPFTEGNPMQIIFVAIVVGLTILVLGEKACHVTNFIEQANYVVQLIMQELSSMIHLFVFGSVFNMILSGKLVVLSRSIKLPLLMLLADLAVIIFYITIVSLRKKVSPLLLIQKLFPTFLIAVSTASSAAAFATNTETCEEKLGIDRQLINIGIPLGQVVFMPGAAVMFFCVGICLAELYSVNITPSWLLTLFLLAVVISIAAPPIPGGALTCYTILICGLKIPAEAITIAVAMNVVMEFVATGINLFCLQMDLIELAGSMDMLDVKVLRSRSGL